MQFVLTNLECKNTSEGQRDNYDYFEGFQSFSSCDEREASTQQLLPGFLISQYSYEKSLQSWSPMATQRLQGQMVSREEMFLSGGSQTAVCTRNPGDGSIRQRRCFSAAGPGILFKGRWRQNAAKNNTWRTIRLNQKFKGCILEKTPLKWFKKQCLKGCFKLFRKCPNCNTPI